MEPLNPDEIKSKCKVIISLNHEEFAKQIAEHLDDNWEVHGDPFIDKTIDNTSFIYQQVLLKSRYSR